MADLKRHIEDLVFERLKPGKVNIIHGARRVGKTHLMRQLIIRSGLKAIWFNCDLPEDFEIISSLNLNNYQAITKGSELVVPRRRGPV